MKLHFAFLTFFLMFGSITSGGESPLFVALGTGRSTTGTEFTQVGSPDFHQAFQRALALADGNQLPSLRGEPEEVTEGESPSFKTSFILQWRACSLVDDSPWTLDCSIDTDRTGSNLQALFTQVTAEAESLGTLEKLPRRRIDNPSQNRYRSPAGSVVDINAHGKTFIQVTFASPPLARKNSAK
jgi:hypothetical protein